MRFLVHKLARTDVLTGAQNGRRLLASLIAQAQAFPAPQPAFLDFTGVSVATSSFLRESVLGFRDYTRSSLANVYPVVANASKTVLEELEYYVTSCGDAIWCCDLGRQEEPRNPRILGKLDDKEWETFRLVARLGHASAPSLAAEHPHAGVKATAWNNRLASLANKGLLVESLQGKTKLFSLVLDAF